MIATRHLPPGKFRRELESFLADEVLLRSVKLRKYTHEELVEWLKGKLDEHINSWSGRELMILKMIREKRKFRNRSLASIMRNTRRERS